MDTGTIDRHSALAELVSIALTQAGVATEPDAADTPKPNIPGWSMALSLEDDETPAAALRRAQEFDDGGTALPAALSYVPGRALGDQRVVLTLDTFSRLVKKLQEHR